MFYLKKLLEKGLSPLGVAIACLLVIFCINQRTSFARRITAAIALLCLILPALPCVARELMVNLENFSPAEDLSVIPKASAIVVLGGTVAPQWGHDYPAEELAGSRLLTAFRLFRLGKAPLILVSSGIAYNSIDGSIRTEAMDMREILLDMGVPPEGIKTEDRSLDTAENAQFSYAALAPGNTDIILVSSAFHMKRATQSFRKAGFRVHPVGAGRSVRPLGLGVMDFIPSAAALARSTSAIKEFFGLLVLLGEKET